MRAFTNTLLTDHHILLRQLSGVKQTLELHSCKGLQHLQCALDTGSAEKYLFVSNL